MSNRWRKYFDVPWPQIVLTLGLAAIIAFVMEPHPLRYALAGFLVLLMVPFIIIRIRESRSRRASRAEEHKAEFKSDDEPFS